MSVGQTGYPPCENCIVCQPGYLWTCWCYVNVSVGASRSSGIVNGGTDSEQL